LHPLDFFVGRSRFAAEKTAPYNLNYIFKSLSDELFEMIINYKIDTLINLKLHFFKRIISPPIIKKL